MDNSRSHQSWQQQRPSWREYARQRRCRMSIEQREQHLARRRANYQANIQKGKQVAASCSTSSTTLPLQHITNTYSPNRMRLTSIRHLARSSNHQQSITGD